MFADRFQTLEGGAEVFYQMSSYTPEVAKDLCYDDLKLGIAWPLTLMQQEYPRVEVKIFRSLST